MPGFRAVTEKADPWLSRKPSVNMNPVSVLLRELLVLFRGISNCHL